MRVSFLRFLLTTMTLVLVALPASGQSVQSNHLSPTVLFICEHGAAKSVIAASWFDKLAKERGLKHRATFRGTHPDPTLASAAVKGLSEDGMNTSGLKPQLVTEQDLQSAAAVVTLGCELPGKDAIAGKLTDWKDLPSPSQDYDAARTDIVKRVRALVDELAKQEALKGTKKTKP